MASFQWIDAEGRFRLAQSGRPGPDVERDFAAWRVAGVNHVVSLQTETEADRSGLGDEPAQATAAGLTFERFAIIDHSVPDDPDAALALAARVVERLRRGEGVVYHCFAGIGRSGLMTILTLMLTGDDLERAASRASVARGLRVPETRFQRRWLAQLEASGAVARSALS